MNIENLKYPIGKYQKLTHIDTHTFEQWVEIISEFPQKINELTKGLSEGELKYIYRPNGWNIKQVVHHCADSHMNSFIRYKLALTEDQPNIKPYFEDRWANQNDYTNANISDSISILKGLHSRWTILLKSLSEPELNREFIHPEHGKKFTLRENTGIYAWHCQHHLAHIGNAIKFKGKF